MQCSGQPRGALDLTIGGFRFLLSLYVALHAIGVEEVVARVVRATGTRALAGCGFATTLMKLALIGPLDTVRAAWPSIEIAAIVDRRRGQDAEAGLEIAKVLTNSSIGAHQ